MHIKEYILQFIWNYQLFSNFQFKSTQGENIEILDYGTWNTNQGPDFLFAKIKIESTLFIGHIEIHTKTSDWILHNHDNNSHYDPLILHVVYQDDLDIENFKNKNIPTLELKDYINPKIFEYYDKISKEFHFIPCEDLIDKNMIPLFFPENALLKKLDLKFESIEHHQKIGQNNYEETLFYTLSYTFGLKINAEIFLQLAQLISYKTLIKIRQNQTSIEALFYGYSGWLLNNEDESTKAWYKEFEFLKSKFNLPHLTIAPKYSRLRPPNFPHYRLSQLANLLHLQPHLFSKIKDAKTITELRDIFSGIKASKYWESHFNFGKSSKSTQEHRLSNDFIDLLIINCILPLKYYFEKPFNPEISNDILELYKALPAEKNTIIKHWEKLGIKITNSLESQGFLYHYKQNCLTKNCLNCSIGFQLLKNDK